MKLQMSPLHRETANAISPRAPGIGACTPRPLSIALALALCTNPPIAAASGEHAGGRAVVTSCADDGSAGTLRSVIAGAASGEVIDLTGLDCGTILLSGTQINVPLTDLTIAGPGRDALTIDAGLQSRVFYHSGTGTLTLKDLTVTRGRADAATGNPTNLTGARGGCVLSYYVGSGTRGSLELTDARVTGCEAVSAQGTTNASAMGGGLYARRATTLTRTIVSDNLAIGRSTGSGAVNVAGGGAALGNAGPILLVDSIITGNRAVTGGTTANTGAVGGGVSSALSDVTVTGSLIADNFAGCESADGLCAWSDGGGLYSMSYDTAINLSGNTITGNTVVSTYNARGGGIAIFANGSMPIIEDTTFAGNRAHAGDAKGLGGGVYLFGGFPTLRRATISGNSADIGGGAAIEYGRLTVTQSTLSGNTAANAGGVYVGRRTGYYGATQLTVNNSTVTANTATAATATGGVAGGIVDTQAAFVTTVRSSLIAGNLAPNANPARADLIAFRGEIGGANNLIVNASGTTLPAGTLSADPVLGPLQDNGGPTWTHALLPGSPAIDVGNNSQNFATDQRGSGFPRVVGTATDIGAFEYRTFAAPTLAAAFAPDDIVGGDTTTLTITLSNANEVAARLTADLLDTLPVPVVLADPVDAVNGCGGSLTATPGAGSFTLGAGAEIPAEGFCTVSVTVTVNASGVFTQTLDAGALQTILGANTDPASATLTVTAPNLPPLAADDAYEVVVDSLLKVGAPGVLSNDSDPNVDPLSAVLLSGPAHGTLWFDPNGGFVYRPEAGFLGTDTFTYAASDGQATTPATVTIMVTPPPHDAVFADGFDSP